MAKQYTTKSGDQWDTIAKAIYGDEKYADYLMSNNFSHLDIYQFNAGVIINTPDLPDIQDSALPYWR